MKVFSTTPHGPLDVTDEQYPDPWSEQLDSWHDEAVTIAQAVSEPDFVVDSNEAYEEAGKLLTQMKGRAKEVDAVRAEAKAPFHKEATRIDDVFRPTLVALRAIEARLKTLIGAWMLKQREEQQRLLLEAQAAADAQRITDPDYADMRRAAALIEEAKHAAPSRLEGVGGREVWRIEVVDPDAVPRDLCSPDLAKLKAAVDAGARAIPGVRIVADVQISARAS